MNICLTLARKGLILPEKYEKNCKTDKAKGRNPNFKSRLSHWLGNFGQIFFLDRTGYLLSNAEHPQMEHKAAIGA